MKLIIVEDEQNGSDRAEYSKETLKNLSKQLLEEFGRGYSVDNLQWMRKFYLMFQKRISQEIKGASGKYKTLSRISMEDPNYETLSRNSVFTLSWSHYIQLTKIEDENERNYYEIEATQNNWSVREPTRQYNAAIYERLALSKDKEGIKQLAQKGQIVQKPTDLLKVIMFWSSSICSRITITLKVTWNLSSSISWSILCWNWAKVS